MCTQNNHKAHHQAPFINIHLIMIESTQKTQSDGLKLLYYYEVNMGF